MKKRIITIAGALGAGKSSTAKGVAAALGYQHFSSGDLFRAIAKERGLSVEEINLAAELEKEIDHAVDERLRAMGEESNLVIDSRLAYHWIPDSFKVFLNLDSETAAERILKHIQTEGRESQTGSSVEELIESSRVRRESEKKRYFDLYQIDTTDLSPFDSVIDTAEHPLKQVIEIVIGEYSAWLEA